MEQVRGNSDGAELQAHDATSRLAATSYLVAVALFATSMVTLWLGNPISAVVPLAILFGWVEVDGLCGASHVCALAPLRTIDPSHHLWRRAVLAYTAGGVVTGAGVGASIGLLTHWSQAASHWFVPASVVIALVMIGHQMKVLAFPLPQVHRQTLKNWAHEYGFVVAAGMWGSHIGLGVATVVAHGGIYVLTALALALGPVAGATIFVSFWIGRALPICLAPLFVSDSRFAGRLLEDIDSATPALRHAAVLAFLGTVVVCAWLIR